MELEIKPTALSLLTRISDFLNQRGIQAYVVGGFVRDLLLARETADIDIALAGDALKAAPDLASAIGGKFVILDEANRVGRVLLDRKDRWQIDLSTIEDGIEADLKRRDFTIDAMAISLSNLASQPEGKPDIIDPFNGLEDIQRRVVRATGGEVFSRDAIRLLRAVRLAAELGFSISQQTETMIRQNCQLITGVAGERIREELLRLFRVGDTGQLLLYLDDLGLLTALIPELAEARGVNQPQEHHWDVFNHSVKAVTAVDFLLRRGSWQYAGKEVLDFVPWSAQLARHFERKVSGISSRRLLLKMAALLHDIAKPQTRITNPQGRTRFFGHPQKGAPIAAGILKRLRFSGKEIKLVEAVVRYHLRPVQMGPEELPSRRAIYRYFRDTSDAAIDTMFFSLADHLATRGPDLDLENWKQHANIVDYVLGYHFKEETVVKPEKLISGHDLIKRFNLSPGPKIGQFLEAVREAQASREVLSREDALSYVDKLLAAEKKPAI